MRPHRLVRSTTTFAGGMLPVRQSARLLPAKRKSTIQIHHVELGEMTCVHLVIVFGPLTHFCLLAREGGSLLRHLLTAGGRRQELC